MTPEAFQTHAALPRVWPFYPKGVSDVDSKASEQDEYEEGGEANDDATDEENEDILAIDDAMSSY